MARVCGSCAGACPDGARFCPSCAAPLDERPQARLERKLATAMFADLVGSTALAEREDPEIVQSVIGRAFDRAAHEVARHGGLVEKFIGDAVLAVFGVPTVHEDDPERAVRAALAVRDAFATLNRRFAEEGKPALAIRTGVETGEVLVDLDRAAGPRHRMLTGDTVNTAARLQQTAEPGQIVVGPVAHEATKDQIEYVALPPRVLKGKAEPTPAWEAVRPKIAPRGERAPLRLRARMVGRDADLRELERIFEQVRSGGCPALVTVLGPAGIGKSRLTFEFVRSLQARPERIDIRKGRCLSYGNVSYSAFAEAIRAACGVLDDDPPHEVARKASTTIEGLFGDHELVPHLEALIGPGGNDRFGREDLFDAWRRLLERMADRSPLVLVLEDLHWADDGLLDLLQHIADWGRGPILLLALARPELLERRPTWDGSGYRAIRLGPLSRDDAEAMLEDLLGTRPSEELTRIVLVRSEGNPLFGEEVVRMLIDRGVIRASEAATWEMTGSVGDTAVPRSIQSLVASRLDSLRRNEKSLAQDAAVVGRVFSAGALLHLSDLSEPEVWEGLDGLQAKELIATLDPLAPSGDVEFAFHHVVIRDVAYESLPKALRADKHVATARWAESQAGDRRDEIAELLATHHLQALRWLDELGETGGRRREVERGGFRWARTAGERARRLWQQREAVRWLRSALDLTARIEIPVEEQAPLWEVYAMAADGVEPYPDVIAAWEEALACYTTIGDLAAVGRVEASIANTALWAGHFDAAGERARRAVERLEPLGDGADLALALFAEGRLELEHDELDRAEPLLRRAMAMAEDVGDSRTQANATIALGWTLHARHRGDETVVLLDRALAVARRAGDLALLLDALEAVFSATIEVEGEYRRAESLGQEALELSKRFGNVGRLSRARLNLAFLLKEMGRLPESYEMGMQALDAGRAVGDPLLVAYSHAVLSVGLCLRRELDAGRTAMATCRAILKDEAIDQAMYVEEFEALVDAYLAMGRGDLEGAADVLADTGRRLSDERLSVWMGELLLFECVRTLIRLDRGEDAVAPRERLARLADDNVPPRAFLAWVDGLLETDPRAAYEGLTDAVTRFERLDRQVELGRCLLDLAEVEERLGRDPAPIVERGRSILAACDARLFFDASPRAAV